MGIFSVIFLRRHLYLFQWLSLVSVMIGVCIVGLSGTILKESASATGSASSAVSQLAGGFATNFSTVTLPASHPEVAAYNLPLSTEPVSLGLFGGLGGIFGQGQDSSRSKEGSGSDEDVPEAIEALLGVLLILFAQIFTASQFVLEEKVSSAQATRSSSLVHNLTHV